MMKKMPDIPEIKIDSDQVKTLFCYKKSLQPFFEKFNKMAMEIYNSDGEFLKKLDEIEKLYDKLKSNLNQYVVGSVGFQINFKENTIEKGPIQSDITDSLLYSKKGKKLTGESFTNMFDQIHMEININYNEMKSFFSKSRENTVLNESLADYLKGEKEAAEFLEI